MLEDRPLGFVPSLPPFAAMTFGGGRDPIFRFCPRAVEVTAENSGGSRLAVDPFPNGLECLDLYQAGIRAGGQMGVVKIDRAITSADSGRQVLLGESLRWIRER